MRNRIYIYVLLTHLLRTDSQPSLSYTYSIPLVISLKKKKKDSKLHTGKPKNPFFPRKMYDKAEKECGTAAVL